MSSRQEEKERRRQERLEREQAEARAAGMRRRLQLVVGGVLAAAAVAAVVVAVSSSGGDGGGGGGTDGSNADAAQVDIPAVKERDLTKAVQTAKCVVRNPKDEGSTHVNEDVTYESNPPTSGNHNPTPADDGIYEPGDEPAKENYVHTLEHGRILIQYKPGTPRARIDQLETLFNEKVNGTEGYHTVLMQNNTNMPYEVAATAWGHLLGCPTFNDGVFDAIRAFRDAYVDKGPEFVP